MQINPFLYDVTHCPPCGLPVDTRGSSGLKPALCSSARNRVGKSRLILRTSSRIFSKSLLRARVLRVAAAPNHPDRAR
jgi:hypothetical protein